MSDFNHPAIKRFLESPSRSSSPLNQGSEAHSVGHSETESLSQPTEPGERDIQGWKDEEFRQLERRPGRNTGKVRCLRSFVFISAFHPVYIGYTGFCHPGCLVNKIKNKALVLDTKGYMDIRGAPLRVFRAYKPYHKN